MIYLVSRVAWFLFAFVTPWEDVMKWSRSAALAFAVCLAVSCSRAPQLDQRIMEMVSVHNQHDVEKELSFYTDDATFVISGEQPVIGKAALRELFASDAAAGSEIAYAGMVVSGDTASAESVSEKSELLLLMGVPVLHWKPGSKNIFKNGLIYRVELTPIEDKDAEIYKKTSADFMKWLAVVHPERVPEFQSTTHSVKSVKAWVEMLREWRAQ